MSDRFPRLCARLGSALVLGLLASCSSQRLFVNQDPAADFGNYRTYGFVEELGTDRPEYGSLLSTYLRAAAARQLEARGYASADTPDLLVNFRLQTAERVETRQVPTPYLGGYPHYGYWSGYAGYEVTQHTEGTLTLDLVDRARRQLVWEAVRIEPLTDAMLADLQAAMERAVAEIFERFPYRAAGS